MLLATFGWARLLCQSMNHPGVLTVHRMPQRGPSPSYWPNDIVVPVISDRANAGVEGESTTADVHGVLKPTATGWPGLMYPQGRATSMSLIVRCALAGLRYAWMDIAQ